MSTTSHPLFPPVVDLFCGCGGMSLGFQDAGFTIQEGFDNWACAVETYRANFTHPATLVDLSDVDQAVTLLGRLRTPTGFPLIIGGPPCQDFSAAGARHEGPRATLTETFAHIVTRCQPVLCVMENVARARSSAAFTRARHILELAGYHVGWIVLDAALCGVPQTRKRLFTIASPSQATVEQILARLRAGLAPTPMAVRDWLGDTLGTPVYYRHPRTYTRRAVFSIDEPSPTIRGVNRPIPAGYRGHRGDAGPISAARPLTWAERASIQTFPPTFHFSGSVTQVEQMIGNAVPVRLAAYVAQAVSEVLTRSPTSPPSRRRANRVLHQV